jgi:hypothetical protein
MSNHLQDLVVRLKKRHPYLALVIGGVVIVLDNIGRAQIFKDLYTNVRAFWGAIHAIWPSHALTWVGAAFVVFGLVSLLLPEKTISRLWKFPGRRLSPKRRPLPLDNQDAFFLVRQPLLRI